MDFSKIKQKLSEMERQRRALEEKIKAAQRKEFQALPARVGLESIDALILALLEYASPAMQAHFKDIASGKGSQDNARVKFSAELRAQIRKELEAGLKSVAQLSREYGPSHPTIMGWKREWGMTHPRSKKNGGSGG
jgi:hypothetical protein